MFVVAQQQTVNFSVEPAAFEETDQITLSFDGSTINESTWGVNNNALYLWSWSFDINDLNQEDCPTNGDWTNSNEANRLEYNSITDEYSISFLPTTFYNRTNIGRIGFLIKAKNGTGDKKSQDILVEVGSFQVNLNTPLENSATILSSGDNLSITASNTNGMASYVLKANGSTINSVSNTDTYSYDDLNIIFNKVYALEVTQAGTTITKSFTVIVDPGTITQSLPPNMQLGINYDSTDETKATIVIDAPFKDFIYVAGSFNNWQPDNTYAMKRDGDRFWIEINGLTPGQVYTYQYWVIDQNPAADSPTLVKTADPFSTVVLSPFDDPFIPSNSFPGLNSGESFEYPQGQEREVTVLQTGQSYPWQIENFNPPKEEDLIVYEVLVRDFDSNRNYQDLIDKIDYFKNLNVNAIQLMPVMEFEGNESWGYNTAWHMALDKFYGTEEKFKEFIDLCHQNDIAIILDIALNHAYGRNPMVRMWMDDPDGDGWGAPSSENPYFNQTARHSYSVGSDFNHQSQLTQDYTKRVIKHWVEDFKIDGFRWDLTKGFTQNCTGSDEGCTNNYQQDRVDILKEYADYSWSLDAEHYVIFEHLGTQNEEKEWANYRLDEGKGIMMWGKMTDPYSKLLEGNGSNSELDIRGIGHESRTQFNGPRVMGYPESQDEERIMYRAKSFGNTTQPTHNVQNIDVALSRMPAIGAMSITVPGPKMIWHFADLGMDNSIWTCGDGTTVDIGNDDCKLATKPQPQWDEDWLSISARSEIYDIWSRLIALKINLPVFEGDYVMSPGSLTPRIDIFDTNIPSSELRNVVILANFDVIPRGISPSFPLSGNWYDLMDNTGATTVNGATPSITIQPGQFRIFGNQPATLTVDQVATETTFGIFPNPANSAFKINKAISQLEIFDITGKLIKSFQGDFSQNDAFNISNLNQGLYLVKIKNNNGAFLTSKLIKQ